MPTYEYKCKSCGHFFEQFQGIKDLPLQHIASSAIAGQLDEQLDRKGTMPSR